MRHGGRVRDVTGIESVDQRVGPVQKACDIESVGRIGLVITDAVVALAEEGSSAEGIAAKEMSESDGQLSESLP
jgi:hypothetical protein